MVFVNYAASRFRTDDASVGSNQKPHCGSEPVREERLRFFGQTAVMLSRAGSLPQREGGSFSSGLARGLDHHLDQRYQTGGQPDPAGRTLGVFAFGASARQEPEQGDNPHTP